MANATLRTAITEADQAAEGDILSAAAAATMAEAAPTTAEKLLTLAASTENLAKAMDANELGILGGKVVEDYEKDKRSRKDWECVAKEMLSLASQDQAVEPKNTPWASSSNVNIPLLTVAALQWNARMYPAAIKGDEAVLCKVIGQDNGLSLKGPDGHPMVLLNGQPVPATVAFQMQQQAQAAQPPQMGPDGQPQPPEPPPPPEIAWQIPPGAKTKRARRVSEYLNTVLFYRMDCWEADTDAMLTQLPIVGCAFRKVWWDAKRGAQSAMVPALRLVVNENIRSLDSAPRITEEIPDTYPHEISCQQREGRFLDVDLAIDEQDEDKPRLLLEQHRYIDLDDDGYDEPYIVTVDKESGEVLRIESNFSPRDIQWNAQRTLPTRITPGRFYVKYGFFPHPQGKFYDIGLGHLLKRVGAVIDTCINQMIDAGNAKVAGGGFIAAGVRLQGRAGRSVIKFAPGEYKTVEVSGIDLRQGIYERTLPDVSPVTFQVLDFIMGFAREIGGIKDILTGQAAATAPVGTVLAQIEQGLQVFNATAKRFFRSARDEYQLLFEKTGRYGGEGAAKDYADVLDDEQADFAKDFASDDLDIRPVSDPSSVTRMQKLAKAQYLESKIGILASVGGDARELLRRSFEAADVEDIDKLLPPAQPKQPDPMQIAELNNIVAMTGKTQADADKANADAVLKAVTAQDKKFDLEHKAIGAGMRAANLG